MAQVNRGKIVPRARAQEAAAREDKAAPRAPRDGRGKIVARAIVDAHQEARDIIERARDEAANILEAARRERARLENEQRTELQRDADARVSAALLQLRAEDEARAERDLDRLIATAVVLAERLVGETLTIDSSRIGVMAKAALGEARGARSITFEANPLDAEALRAQLQALGLPEDAARVQARDDLARGDLVLVTDLGSIDARLKPQLQRLAEALSRAGRK